jgi:DNA (cytosine-5)-methyltransferase 1
MREINLLDLFSGIGGFHLGLERAGFKVNAYNSEIDKYAIDVYKHNFKNATYVGSVTDVRAEQLPRIDAITFGSPCQDFSLAGKRKGMGGSRSSLITDAIRLIDECRPSFFIWENVKGTFSSNNGADFWAIIQAFANIGGYRLEWQLLNTKWFLPQNRERIYLVGHLGDGGGGQIFPIGEDNRQINELQGLQGNTCTLTTRYGADGNGSYIVERKLNAQEVKILGYSRDSNGVVVNRSEKNEANTIYSSSGQGGNTDQFVKYNYGQKSLNETLQKENLSKDQVKALDLYNKKAQDDSPTLTEPHHNSLRLFEYGNIRRLTPVECERLQGFPDNWTKYGTQGEISDSQRYKMCGNAVTVDVVKAVANKIKQTLNK